MTESFCGKCGRLVKLVGAVGLCFMCWTVASPPAGAAVRAGPVLSGPVVTAQPFASGDSPHDPEHDYSAPPPAAEASAGAGGQVIQEAATLSGEGTLEAAAMVTPAANLGGEGKLLVPGTVTPGATLIAGTALTAGADARHPEVQRYLDELHGNHR